MIICHIPHQLHLIQINVSKVTTSIKDEKKIVLKKLVEVKSSLIGHVFSSVYESVSSGYVGPLWVESILPFLCVMH